MAKAQYLISKGVVNLLETRYKLDLSNVAKEKIRTLEDDFVERLGEELESTFDFKVISAETIDDLMEEVRSRKNGLPVINLDDVYFRENQNDGEVSITRLVTDVNDFDKKTLGPRKGYKPLEEQLKDLNKYRGQEVALMDIGVFEGETLLDEEKGIAGLLKKKGIKVKRLYTSIMNSPSKIKFESAGIEIVSGREYDFTDGDWLEVRDLLGLDGRKINPAQYYLNGNTQLFARYIQDPQTLKVGAGIADGVTAAIVLDLCNMYQKKIMREVRRDGYQVIEGSINSDPRLYTLEFKRDAKVRP